MTKIKLTKINRKMEIIMPGRMGAKASLNSLNVMTTPFLKYFDFYLIQPVYMKL
jgi:hypothetical protein